MPQLLLCTVCMLVFSTLAFSQDPSCDASTTSSPSSMEVVLLDTFQFMSLPWTIHNGAAIHNSSSCRPIVELCVTGEQHLVSTMFIPKPSSASLFSVVVNFTEMCTEQGDGTSSTSCNFDLLIHQSSSTSVDSNTLSTSASYVNIGTVRSGESISVSVEQAGFYLGFFSQDTICVNITRVRVTYTNCPAATNSYVEYLQSGSGSSVTGVCVPNSVSVSSGPLMAFCNLSMGYQFPSTGCQCSAGYKPSSDQLLCEACPSGTFKSSPGSGTCDICPKFSESFGANTSCTCIEGHMRSTGAPETAGCFECTADYHNSSGFCTRCPSNSGSSGGIVAVCMCDSGRATQAGANTTSGDHGCDRCLRNFYLSGQDCMSCPQNSERSFTSSGEENMCECSGNSSISNGNNMTDSAPCVGCRNGFFIRSQGSDSDPVMCDKCPTNSDSTAASDENCKCDSGATLEEGSSEITTTDVPCSGCAANHFRNENGVCLECPENSFRRSSIDDQNMCNCKTGYGRSAASTASNKCAPFIGFEQETIMVSEGNHNIPIKLSASTSNNFSVPFDAGEGVDYVTPRSPLNYPSHVNITNIQIVVPNNEMALEEPKTFTIALQSTVDAVAEKRVMPTLYDSIQVTITDDDRVRVGFTTEKVKYNESEKDLYLNISRLDKISGNFELTIKSDDQDDLRIPNNVVIFSPDITTVSVPFEIIDNFVGGMSDRTVILTLEYSKPERFRSNVDIGGGGTYSNIMIVITEDDASVPPSAFPVAGIIGASMAAAGLAVLLLLIVILCFCIFRLHVNRQGFYPTYEDKTSEPPTMLRYSASLRSISSQTVVGVQEGKSVTRENEFYV